MHAHFTHFDQDPSNNQLTFTLLYCKKYRLSRYGDPLEGHILSWLWPRASFPLSRVATFGDNGH